MKILNNSKVRVLVCKEGHHNGRLGTIQSKRQGRGYNVILQYNQKCVALKVRFISSPKKILKQNFIKNMLAGIGIHI